MVNHLVSIRYSSKVLSDYPTNVKTFLRLTASIFHPYCEMWAHQKVNCNILVNGGFWLHLTNLYTTQKALTSKGVKNLSVVSKDSNTDYRKCCWKVFIWNSLYISSHKRSQKRNLWTSRMSISLLRITQFLIAHFSAKMLDARMDEGKKKVPNCNRGPTDTGPWHAIRMCCILTGSEDSTSRLNTLTLFCRCLN